MPVANQTNTISTTTLDCGALLLVESIPSVASVAMNWMLPVGSASDSAETDGYAALLSELLFRGAGDLSSREHSEALDCLGVQRDSDVATHFMHLRMTLLGDRLDDTLPLATSMLLAPTMPDAAMEPVRSLALQSLESLDDDPQHQVMLHLRHRHQPPPLNRNGYGERAVLERASLSDLRQAWKQRCTAGGSILCAAGDVDANHLAGRLNELLAGWGGQHTPAEATGPAARGKAHLSQDTAQVHIALAYDAPAEREEHSMLERLATRVLSGSTSGRLFTEVRQKRSLCYSVGASYRAGKNAGHVSLYAGTTPERAQQTLDVCRAEIERMREGVEPDEFHRAVIGLKSQLVMSGESTAARAGALGHDQFRLGRTRTLDEITAAIDAITLDDLNAYLATRDFAGDEGYTMACIGPIELA